MSEHSPLRTLLRKKIRTYECSLKFCLFAFSRLNLKVLFTDLCVRWNLHSEIGLNEKKER